MNQGHRELADQGRVWVEFDDPADATQRFRCDLTWLTSSYECIFGRGCPGLRTERPDDGCCGLGAHFSDADDVRRVGAVVAELTTQTWQFAQEAARSGWREQEDDEPKTRVFEGACILLNRPGFPTGAGCALHQQAVRDGVPALRTKPDVCWQLPLHRDYRTVTLPDDTSYTEVSIGEYSRGRWGPGGHDFDWYCSASTLAHRAARPLYRTCADELTELMGTAGYAELSRRAQAHLIGVAAVRNDAEHMHPAGRALLPLLVHPATLAADPTDDAAHSPTPRDQARPTAESH
ncbi:MAG: hypothetical protein Q4P32_10150 [Micrococcales bacterium]|nr:hypothetical protein [Micrococcales bacterium]